MNNEMIHYLIPKGQEWITNQRSIYFPTAQKVSAQDKTVLVHYFEPSIIDSARIRFVDYIENPPFYPEIMRLGIPNLINFTQMEGITFVDCILISRRFSHSQKAWTSLLFHEMVHVTQYNILGVQRFAELYVLGWANNGFVYENIPLERQAYYLQNKFNEGGLPFSVTQYLSQQVRCIG